MQSPVKRVLATTVVALVAVAGCSDPADDDTGGLVEDTRVSEEVRCADEGGDILLEARPVGPKGDVALIPDIQLFDLVGDASSLTEDDIVDACLRQDGAEYTLCEAYSLAETSARYAVDEPHPDEVHGPEPDVTHEPESETPPGFVVVIRAEVDCDDLSLTLGGAPLQIEHLRPWTSVDRFNRLREVDRKLLESSRDSCWDLAHARNRALEAREQLHGGWLIIEYMSDWDGDACFEVMFEHGFVLVRPYRLIQE